MDKLPFIVFGGGCFWCLEAVFQRVPGVVSVAPGYAGGHLPDPTYHQVCSGDTGHAEVVRVVYDPVRMSTGDLLDWFFRCHNPTTLNLQGADAGTQYRSIVFFSDEKEHGIIKGARDRAQLQWGDPIVTEIVPLAPFYPAEEVHRNYFNENAGQGYCRVVIQPKLAHLGLSP